MPKHRIFIKIYLWFWLTTIVIGATMPILDRITKSGPMIDEMQRSIGHTLLLYGPYAIDIFERESVSSLDAFINHLKESSNIRIFLFDNKGSIIGGQKEPQGITKLLSAAEKKSGAEFIFSEKEILAAQKFTSSKGETYFVAGEIIPPPHGPGNERPRPHASFLRLIIIMLVTGVICYYLARYFTTPIIDLSNAVRQFAAGNHSVRVGPFVRGRKDEISGLANDFDLMADRIESLITSQNTLLRDLSHELRTPLARLNVALELCRQQCVGETGKCLDRIGREADKLNELIGQILILNRFESGVSVSDKTDINLAKLIKEIAEDANFESGNMNRAVKIVKCDDCSIIGSKELLRRAVENVVRNALLYTSDGSEVEVSLSHEQNKYISIIVRDYGPGVPEEEISCIFKPFYRVGEDRDRKTGGAGIGLAITEAAVRLHDGNIKASNAPGGGFIVEITFPIA